MSAQAPARSRARSSLRMKAVEVGALDNSEDALALAGQNNQRLRPDQRARIHLVSSDGYSGVLHLARQVALVVSNPPYLAEHEWESLDPVVRDFDPKNALVAGVTGMEMIARVIAGAPELLRVGGAAVVEIAPHQAANAVACARSANAREVEIARDLVGRDRVLVARW